MKTNCKGLCIAIGLFLASAFCGFAQTATITEITGTVELQRRGQTAWENAQAGQTIAMDVRGPVITASVRGTVFEISTSEMVVIEGTVAVKGRSGVAVLIDKGGRGTVDERSGRAALPVHTMLSELKPNPPIGSELFDGARINAGSTRFEIITIFEY